MSMPHDHEHPSHLLAPETIRFCPLCGAPLIRRLILPDRKEEAVCPTCDFVFYLNPKLVAGAIPAEDGRVLLVLRAIEPALGKWTFPGGFVEWGESVGEAAVRETQEETGLAVHRRRSSPSVDLRSGQFAGGRVCA